MLPFVLLAAGLALLVVGAEALVRGASRIALAMGISRLVVGLVLVSIGTSTPEIGVGVRSAWEGSGDLALGNAVGSNIFNVLFALGLAAVISPLVVQSRIVRLDVPIMIALAALLVGLCVDGELSRVEGIVLLAVCGAYLLLNLVLARREGDDPDLEVPGAEALEGARRGPALARAAALVVGGLALLLWGANLTVDAATALARAVGASDLVVGLTVVAIGTSLPEVATTVVAVVRGERDLAVGNIVGSNIINGTLILGLSSVIAGGLAVARGALTFDLPVMLVVSFVVLPVIFTRQLIARWEGALFLAYYVAYVTHLLLTATVHPLVDELQLALVWFALPLTFIVLVASVVREARRRGRAPA